MVGRAVHADGLWAILTLDGGDQPGTQLVEAGQAPKRKAWGRGPARSQIQGEAPKQGLHV